MFGEMLGDLVREAWLARNDYHIRKDRDGDLGIFQGIADYDPICFLHSGGWDEQARDKVNELILEGLTRRPNKDQEFQHWLPLLEREVVNPMELQALHDLEQSKSAHRQGLSFMLYTAGKTGAHEWCETSRGLYDDPSWNGWGTCPVCQNKVWVAGGQIQDHVVMKMSAKVQKMIEAWSEAKMQNLAANGETHSDEEMRELIRLVEQKKAREQQIKRRLEMAKLREQVEKILRED